MEYANRPEFKLTPEAYIFGALALLVLPLKWLAAAVLAAGFHECCHALALWLCGVRICGITIGPGGAVMETEPMGEGRAVICALAGPLGSFLLILLIRHLPELAVCAGIQGLYNLLPIFPLDGGRALSNILEICCPERREPVMKVIRWIVVLTGLILGFLGFFCFRLGAGVLIPAFLLIRKGMERKRPCKEAHKRVQ